jgi:hypothetical protein
MPSIYTSIRLPAPPQDIWDILTDFEHYPEWNPYFQKVSGEQCSKVSIYSDEGWYHEKD